MAEERRKLKGCYCHRQRMYRHQQKKGEQCKKKRQTLVFNSEEEMYHEPYMRNLKKEFSDVSILCDSKIELPWKDIALPAAGMRIRQDLSLTPLNGQDEDAGDEAGKEPTEEESLGTMALPWKDLIITEVVQSKQADPESCDSTLEIPWNDLVLQKPIEIRVPSEESCDTDDVEIPWNDILIPRNIVIESPKKKKKHPSSKYPPRAPAGAGCGKCKACCANVLGSKMTASCN